jgi:predicted ATPase
VSTTSEAAVIVEFSLAQPRRHRHEPGAPATVETVLDGKYAALDEVPRRVLRRLSIFVGEFTLEAACCVAACTQLDRAGVADGIAVLQASSFLLSDYSEGCGVHYLLSLPARLFALGKLIAHQELDRYSGNHAQYLQYLLEYAEVEFDRREPGGWLTSYTSLLDDVRAALDWAFSPSGNASMGVDLTMAAIPLWLMSSQSDELQRRIGRALKSEAAMSHSGRQMRLRTAARLAGMSDF